MVKESILKRLLGAATVAGMAGSVLPAQAGSTGNGAAFLDAQFREPWCVVARGKLPRLLMPEATHLVHYHYVDEGSCLTRTEYGRDGAALSAGDVVVFPHGDSHLLGSDLQLAPHSIADMIRPPRRGEVTRVQHGGDGAKTRLVCGFLACDQ